MNIHDEFTFELTDLGVEILNEFYKKEFEEVSSGDYSDEIKSIIFKDLLRYKPNKEKLINCKMSTMFEILKETEIDWQFDNMVVFVGFRKEVLNEIFDKR